MTSHCSDSSLEAYDSFLQNNDDDDEGTMDTRVPLFHHDLPELWFGWGKYSGDLVLT